MSTATATKISIPRAEYLRLKELDALFRDFFAYFEHVTLVRQARREITLGKGVPQEKVFKKLGL